MINLSLTLVNCYNGHEQFISVPTYLRQYPESNNNSLKYPPICECHNRVDGLQCHQIRNDIHTHTNRQTEQTTDNKSDKNVLSAYASALVTSVTESSYGSVSMSHHRHI